MAETTPTQGAIDVADILTLTGGKSIYDSERFQNKHMPFFDTRVYRKIALYNKATKQDFAAHTSNIFYPHYDYGSYNFDFFNTPGSIQRKIDDCVPGSNDAKILEQQRTEVMTFAQKNKNSSLAPRSFVHPYAIVKLAGAFGEIQTVKQSYTFDAYNKRKFYEIDGGENFASNYSKTPTTTKLVRWGMSSPRNKTPYSFQDFAFCKWWNKIENNRLITLRRYAAPVTDNIEFADYEVSQKTDKRVSGTHSSAPYTPLATAVTYFGEETGNRISDILSFTAGRNWEEKTAEENPMMVSSQQNDAGQNLINGEDGGVFGALSGGMGYISKIMGFLGEVTDGKTINLQGAPGEVPPDPYSDGPYENRILGPINVIMNTYRRKRGLHFSQDGLKIKFEYVARPIAGINNKAILLDLLANMLVLTYASGTWFGGMLRYRCTSPAVYPFKYGDTMNKLYRGEIFGQKGALQSLTDNIFADCGNGLTLFLSDAFNALGNILSGMFAGGQAVVSGMMNAITGGDTEEKQKSREEKKKEAKERFEAAFNTNTMRAVQKVIAAKALKNTTIPFLHHLRALMTGEPVGEWHLTIGNPFNPIAMIGNLIVKDVNITFSDELGPDDFPIGFTATVTLDHGLGRDRDAIESMFNRGYGRIYTLSDQYRSSSDSETKIDDYTGGLGTKGAKGRTGHDIPVNTYYGGGTDFIMKTQHSKLRNTGTYMLGTNDMEFLKPAQSYNLQDSLPGYYVNPWMMSYTL